MKNAIFIHIPKTAGSTLQGIINRQYSANTVFNTRNDRVANEFNALSVEKKKKIKILKGHMAYGHHMVFEHPDDVVYFTMLRKPENRILSLYYFIIKQTNHHTHHKIMSKNMSLKEFVESGINLNTNNCHIRLLANKIDTPFNECTRDMLEEAKHNLEERFAVVGLTECFDASIIKLKNEFGWKNPYYRRTNITGHKKTIADLDPETLGTIQKYNSLDIELYDWAKKRFEHTLEQLGPSFEKQLKSFQRKNLWVQKALATKDKLLFKKS